MPASSYPSAKEDLNLNLIEIVKTQASMANLHISAPVEEMKSSPLPSPVKTSSSFESKQTPPQSPQKPAAPVASPVVASPVKEPPRPATPESEEDVDFAETVEPEAEPESVGVEEGDDESEDLDALVNQADELITKHASGDADPESQGNAVPEEEDNPDSDIGDDDW